MKTLKILLLISLVISTNLLFAQQEYSLKTADSTGLPGDYFSLQGALELFKESKSLEEFEKKINAENNSVNNLDLNGDGNVDYVRVVDNTKDNSHAIVLQVPISNTESQDIAVIEIEKNGNESAILQIIGDNEIYGENIILEPFAEKDDVKGKTGPANYNSMPVLTVVNIWFWPCVQFVYSPAYIVWVSPWSWNYYPKYWKPWTPHSWRWHYQHCNHYNAYYHHVKMHRVVVAHKIYTPHRKTSVIVNNRYKKNHENYKGHRGSVNNKTGNNVNKTNRVRSSSVKGQKPTRASNGGRNSGKNGSGGNAKRK
ncbi:MAG: hypothetical protein HY951_00470 [Bacteroidia bacterium]|nr:hypothetical protein [Bacteroidia bacterium]